MKVVGAVGTLPWVLVPCEDLGHCGCEGLGIVNCHRCADDYTPDHNLGPNRLLVSVPYLPGSVLLRSVDMCELDPQGWEAGELVVRLFSNERVFCDDAGPIQVYAVMVSDVAELNLTVHLLTDLCAAERIVDGYLRDSLG